MVNDNTPSPRKRRKRPKPRVTKRAIDNMKLILRVNRRLLKQAVPEMRPAIERGIAQLERWIKAYGG